MSVIKVLKVDVRKHEDQRGNVIHLCKSAQETIPNYRNFNCIYYNNLSAICRLWNENKEIRNRRNVQNVVLYCLRIKLWILIVYFIYSWHTSLAAFHNGLVYFLTRRLVYGTPSLKGNCSKYLAIFSNSLLTSDKTVRMYNLIG